MAIAAGGTFLAAALLLLAVSRWSPPSATPVPPPAPPPVATGVSAQTGRVLLADNFDDPLKGFLPSISPDPSKFRLGYVDGEYEIAGPAGASVALPGSFRDTAISLDAHILGSATQRAIGIACRASEKGWYLLTITPDTRSFTIAKYSFTAPPTTLVDDQVSEAIQRGNATNHIEFGCAGSTISANANGTLLGSAEDSDYQDGWFQIAVTGVPDPAGAEDIAMRIDNLVVTSP